jgi:hypoxanthine phosphoribosyltransferase
MPDPASTAGVLLVDWPLFGELSRALALKVARDFRPDLVVGIATAGVVPGAAVAAILDVPFHSMLVTRRRPDVAGVPQGLAARTTPAVFGAAPSDARGARVLVVDETCDSGDTMRLAVAALGHAGAVKVRSAVCFRRGPYAPDFHALATRSVIVLPWDREILVGDQLRPNPRYAGALPEAVG